MQNPAAVRQAPREAHAAFSSSPVIPRLRSFRSRPFLLCHRNRTAPEYAVASSLPAETPTAVLSQSEVSPPALNKALPAVPQLCARRTLEASPEFPHFRPKPLDVLRCDSDLQFAAQWKAQELAFPNPPRFSRLNTQPACAPVNASRRTLRCVAHDSGSGWFATPFLCDSFIHYSTTVFTSAPGDNAYSTTKKKQLASQFGGPLACRATSSAPCPGSTRISTYFTETLWQTWSETSTVG